MAELEAGKQVPDLQLATAGRIVKPEDLRGSVFVVYFYPQDDTETCTVEAISFSRLKAEFEAAGVAVFGVSPDSLAKHEKFAAKHKLTVDLASDEDGKLVRAWGVWAEKKMFGRTYMGVLRTTFLVGRDGRISRVWKKVRVKGHAEEVLAAAKEL